MSIRTGYSLVIIILHWLMAVMILVLFPLGIWMTSLDYYASYYRAAFLWHESIGMLVLALLPVRFVWRLFTASPNLKNELPRWQYLAAKTAHWLFYILIAVVCISGYLISTAEGQSVSIWNVFKVPALASFEAGFADQAGVWHWYAAWILIALVGIHTLAALYHHFILRDNVLLHIIKGGQHEK